MPRENWKKRALIAEEKVRHFTQISALFDLNGNLAIYSGSGGLPVLVISKEALEKIRQGKGESK